MAQILNFPSPPGLRALVLTGPNGVGKTTTALEIYKILGEMGHTTLFLDLDHLTNVIPIPEDDPHNSLLGIRNLASMWPNFADRNVEYAIVARIIEDPADRDLYEKSFGEVDLRVVRITASSEVRRTRIIERRERPNMEWELVRTEELEKILSGLGVEDFVVSNDGLTPKEVALKILEELEWPT